MVRNPEPFPGATGGNQQYMMETVNVAASGILARVGTAEIASLELDDIVSRSESQPGSPIIGGI